jgi:hypothetical protein
MIAADYRALPGEGALAGSLGFPRPIAPMPAPSLLRVCAVKRRRFPVGARPTRQPLQPEATGAVMEVTKWLKPSESVSRIGDSASVSGDMQNQTGGDRQNRTTSA